MDPGVGECELAERDPGLCVCKEGPTLDILKDIQRLYEEKLEQLDRACGITKMQQQVDLLRSWVSDLVGQNTLLARAVEELETEATTKLMMERQKNSERGSKNIICSKVSELKLLNESLHKENMAKEREIRQLNKDAQAYEQTIMNLRKEMSSCKYHRPEVPKKDAEVMAGMCCTGTECPGAEPRTSTPNVSCAPLCGVASSTPNISFIERSCSVSALVSDSSIADLECHFQKHNASFSKDQSNNTVFCTPRGSLKTTRCNDSKNSSCQASPRECSFESPRDCPWQESTPGCPLQGSPRRCPNQEPSCPGQRPPPCQKEPSCPAQRPPPCQKEPSCPAQRPPPCQKEPSCPGQRPPPCQKSADSSRCCGEGGYQRGLLNFAQRECPAKRKNKQDCKCNKDKVDCKCHKEEIFCKKCHKEKVHCKCPKEEIFCKKCHKEKVHCECPKEEIFCKKCHKEKVHCKCPKEEIFCKKCHKEKVHCKCPKEEIFCKKCHKEKVHCECPKEEIFCKKCHKEKVHCKCPKEEIFCKKCHKEKVHCKCPKEEIFCKKCHKEKVDCECPKEEFNCECVEEIYFNDEAKSCCSSPKSCYTDRSEERRCNQTPSEFFCQLRKGLNCNSCTKMRNLKDSGATCSLIDSSNATCDASFYHSKLLATLQILQNKEETIGVQADSLAVAEERIATLTDRANELKKELDRKTKENQTLRKIADCCKVVKHDVCVVTDRPMEDQRAIVTTLENNLSVIEELYRECFYETAKQENLIEMLRSSYLDVRLMEKQKADQIGHLQTVIDKQKWSIDRYQDIASEVDGLKTEISNFLNSTTSTSTNHDSGMWERSEDSLTSVPAVQDDLQDLTEQLLRLQDLLAVGDEGLTYPHYSDQLECSCGLKEENIKLKKEAEGLRIKMGDLQQKLCSLEGVLALKTEADLKYQAEMEMKHQELSKIREELARSQEDTCEAMSMQLRRTKALLDEKTELINQLKQENECQAEKIQSLQEELDKADSIIKENCKMRSEVSYLSAQVELWRAQLEDSQRHVCALDQELARTRAHTQQIDACYREKASAVAELQAHLEQAYARGAALCGESRRAVGAVRTWMRRMRDKHREQEALLKERDALLEILQRRLEEQQSESHVCPTCEKLAPCSKCQSSRDDRSFTSKPRSPPCCSASPSEMPSCSSTPPACRVSRNKEAAAKRCKAWMCDTSVQLPERRESGSDAPPRAACCGLRGARHVRLSRATLQLQPGPASPRRSPRQLQAASPSASCAPVKMPCVGPSSSCAPVELPCAGPSSSCAPLQLKCAGSSPSRASPSPGRRASQLQSPDCECQSPGVARRCPGRAVSPTEELLQRVEQLSDALADGSRRWGRGRGAAAV
ncbi:uncharacterized protein LOC118273279 isoform X6 [Spodoptera frugiperda]|uniref:Uncharacterized protein LOC118273279 isoform X6 n=1 Tax=Spodoptera frugiperda TaxID=7108 RepID=A0A9R0ETK6_SPOFR|nr:uncharacterized protein LOC118273279 isoform X6 [Spodoptera frugiperda]